MTAPAPVAEVIGDNTTAGGRARARWRRAAWPITIAVTLAIGALIAALLPARTSQIPLAPDNPGDHGAMATAEILRSQGVRVDYVTTLDQALARATDESTLLAAGTDLFSLSQVDRLRDTAADLVVVAPTRAAVSAVTDGSLRTTSSGGSGLRAADCPDPDARAAGRIRSLASYDLAAADSRATVCFPGAEGGVYGVVDEADRRIVVIADSRILTNEALTEDGNAALALRALGRHEHLIWYVPSLGDMGVTTPGPPTLELLPPYLGILLLQLLVVVAVIGLWRGRRMGRVVSEPLPVLVPLAETARGRGRLYRRGKALGRAAAALRAGTARRTAGLLGLARSAGAQDVIDALVRATGRVREDVAALIYGPPPTNEAELAALARSLDELESEVHRK